VAFFQGVCHLDPFFGLQAKSPTRTNHPHISQSRVFTGSWLLEARSRKFTTRPKKSDSEGPGALSVIPTPFLLSSAPIRKTGQSRTNSLGAGEPMYHHLFLSFAAQAHPKFLFRSIYGAISLFHFGSWGVMGEVSGHEHGAFMNKKVIMK
jgi:hypothetical protein